MSCAFCPLPHQYKFSCIHCSAALLLTMPKAKRLEYIKGFFSEFHEVEEMKAALIAANTAAKKKSQQ